MGRQFKRCLQALAAAILAACSGGQQTTGAGPHSTEAARSRVMQNPHNVSGGGHRRQGPTPDELERARRATEEGSYLPGPPLPEGDQAKPPGSRHK